MRAKISFRLRSMSPHQVQRKRAADGVRQAERSAEMNRGSDANFSSGRTSARTLESTLQQTNDAARCGVVVLVFVLVLAKNVSSNLRSAFTKTCDGCRHSDHREIASLKKRTSYSAAEAQIKLAGQVRCSTRQRRKKKKLPAARENGFNSLSVDR